MDRLQLGLVFTVFAVSLSAPLAAFCTDNMQLTPEVATLGTLPDKQSSPASAPGPKTLYGSVRKRDQPPDAANAAKQSLQSEAAASGAAATEPDLHALAEQKLADGVELTPDEYRSLGAGCAGYESERTFFKKIGKIVEVYPGSPADKAGIRVGDKIISNDSDEQAKSDPTQPLWSVSCGLVGTPVSVTLLRHNHPITLTLIRMNIEDIQDDKARHSWENIIRNLGHPTEGTFTRKSLEELESPAD